VRSPCFSLYTSFASRKRQSCNRCLHFAVCSLLFLSLFNC